MITILVRKLYVKHTKTILYRIMLKLKKKNFFNSKPKKK